MRRVAAFLALAFAVAACGGDDATDLDPTTTPDATETAPADDGDTADPTATACQTAVEEAASSADADEAAERMDAAIAACIDLEEIRTATADFPDTISGGDVEAFVRERCEASDEPAVTDSAICEEVGAGA